MCVCVPAPGTTNPKNLPEATLHTEPYFSHAFIFCSLNGGTLNVCIFSLHLNTFSTFIRVQKTPAFNLQQFSLCLLKAAVFFVRSDFP